MTTNGKLTFFCGKMGAGKSTCSKRLTNDNQAVLISEDEWLSAHYPDQIKNFEDYLTYSALIKPFVKSHVQNILKTASNVVMDFPANTKKQRQWFKGIVTETGCEHELIFLDLSDEQCLIHIARRRIEQPQRAQFDNKEVFYHVTQFFEAPTESEAFNITK